MPLQRSAVDPSNEVIERDDLNEVAISQVLSVALCEEKGSRTGAEPRAAQDDIGFAKPALAMMDDVDEARNIVQQFLFGRSADLLPFGAHHDAVNDKVGDVVPAEQLLSDSNLLLETWVLRSQRWDDGAFPDGTRCCIASASRHRSLSSRSFARRVVGEESSRAPGTL